MTSVAVYNMKGGVGKTTAAVNLAFLSAARGARTLLWDLDPQAASSFAFRVRPRVEAFDRKSLRGGRALADSIKATDYGNLDILPAAFAYRKFDRILDRLGSPARVVGDLLESIGGDYDVVFLDCSAGFSLLIEGIFVAADAVLVPAIPSVLSLRTLVRLLKWAKRSRAPVELMAFLNMVDLRKMLHRRLSEWSADVPDVFLRSQVPYASVVEEMPVQRAPLSVFARHHAATDAFVAVDEALHQRLRERARLGSVEPPDWAARLAEVEGLLERLESDEALEPARSAEAGAGAISAAGRKIGLHAVIGSIVPPIVHRFDTDRGELEGKGWTLELREARGSFLVLLAPTGEAASADATRRVQVQVDRSWAAEVLSGVLSPLTVLERRIGRSGPVREACVAAGGRPVVRVGSRRMGSAFRASQPPADVDPAPVLPIVQAG